MAAIDELATIVRELPRPLGDWHAWTPEIAAVAADLQAAVDAVASVPEAAAELDALVEEAARDFTQERHGLLAEARERLASLPRPDGRHPYLDLIMPALEAGDVLYEVLARHPGAADLFARRLLREAA